MQLETPLATVQAAAELAARAGVPVILNPAPARALPDALLQLVSILTPNETEAELLTGIEVTDAATAARRPTGFVRAAWRPLSHARRSRGLRGHRVDPGTGSRLQSEGCGYDRGRGRLQRGAGRCPGGGQAAARSRALCQRRRGDFRDSPGSPAFGASPQGD